MVGFGFVWALYKLFLVCTNPVCTHCTNFSNKVCRNFSEVCNEFVHTFFCTNVCTKFVYKLVSSLYKVCTNHGFVLGFVQIGFVQARTQRVQTLFVLDVIFSLYTVCTRLYWVCTACTNRLYEFVKTVCTNFVISKLPYSQLKWNYSSQECKVELEIKDAKKMKISQ